MKFIPTLIVATVPALVALIPQMCENRHDRRANEINAAIGQDENKGRERDRRLSLLEKSTLPSTPTVSSR